ncbi:hypothetical protein BCV69DRAFT_279551 [Microstroma glucosiphilum]|uniref:UBR-type domain-containing protein n=1 Tax=Pseudomicrostroma glucosiphilum TaxID=1684307 RepID=A0A316UEH2_9BASI|nr:hypothetical protein BCV69DRAFT_279551 [Pseudomicrostroma glucosiphilum]PWN23619.1 hypothetical protein BCV69DRAFT_279551 [Pseudomicrostroma glucosiphilum]
MADGSNRQQSPHTSSSRTFTRVPSATSLLPPSSAQGLTAADLLSHQALLESQAREAIPFSHTTCTYSNGYIRQPLWACKDCGGGGVCAGCSVGCHASHELVELFAKRGTRCDCGTLTLQRHVPAGLNADKVGESSSSALQPCNLRAAPLNFAPENDLNVYGKNHDGHFCYCEKGYTYDPMEEEETMFQCMVCEDWLHETCVSLRPKKGRRKAHLVGEGQAADSSSETKPPDAPIAVAPDPAAPFSGPSAISNDQEEQEGDDPPPLISHDSFDNVICDACLRKHPILQHYIGAPSWGTCLRLPSNGTKFTDLDTVGGNEIEVEADDGLRKYLILGLPVNTEYATGSNGQYSAAGAAGLKRELSPIVEGADDGDEEESRQVKRVKVEETPTTTQEPGAPSMSAEPGAAETTSKARSAEGQTSNPDVTSSTSSGCKLPPIHPLVEHLLSLPDPLASTTPHPNNPGNEQRSAYRIDVYLDEGSNEEGDLSDPLGTAFNEGGQMQGFRKEICRCPSCLEAFKDLPFLLEEEETYSPPASQSGLPAGVQGGDGDQDDDARSASSHSSTYDLGLDALNRLPRAQTLEAMEGYGRLRAALFEHLRPFAQSGKTVDEESIRRFFEEQRERDRQGR